MPTKEEPGLKIIFFVMSVRKSQFKFQILLSDWLLFLKKRIDFYALTWQKKDFKLGGSF